ncbi:MAG TPA: histidine kinase [Blastocatellia bacterium]|nr:histidine kinase [Blastocatellia bacterium]
MWRVRSRRWLLILGIWMLPGLYFAFQVYLQRAFDQEPLTFMQALWRGLIFWLLWAISSPLILWLARMFPIPRREWLDGLLFHLPAGFIFSLAHLLCYVLIISWLSHGFPPSSLSELLAEFQPIFTSSFAWWSLVYWTILIATYAFDYYGRYQDGAIKASQLEAQLAQAQLQTLKMQLHPHFLFNTLHSISALLREDPEAADQMIARLGDFLRMTLQNSGEQVTTLEKELGFLRCYLEIEQIRFQDRLETRFEVDPAAMDAHIPNLLLQPIVENAIRHGVAARQNRGAISIRARRDHSRLLVQVEDNGPGLSTPGDNKQGVGLTNTRARLQHLYGEDFRCEMNNVAEGGLVVTLEFPLQRI